MEDVNASVSGNINVSPDLSFELTSISRDLSSISSNLDVAILLAVAIAGCAIGWRKILPALVFFVAIDSFNNSSLTDHGAQVILLLLLVIIWHGLKNLGLRIRKFFKHE